MKKVMVMLVAGAFISTSIISCSNTKCGHCDTNGTSGGNLCSRDNKIVYDAAVTSCATGGGSWVLK